MKIRQYIKRMATLALMVASLAPLQEAWGKVTGDKYEEVKKYYATVDDGSTDKLQRVFDGDEPGTWWDAFKAGTREIIVDFNEEKELAIIKYHGGGNGQGCIPQGQQKRGDGFPLRGLQHALHFSLLRSLCNKQSGL